MKYEPDAHKSLGTFLIVEAQGGTAMFVKAADEDKLAEAMQKWLDEDRDTLLVLTLLSGDPWRVPVSEVRHVALSTPSGRVRNHEINQKFEAINADDDKEKWQTA